MSEHTKEPWSFRRNYNESLDFFGNDGGVAIMCNVRMANQYANARRIVACVNACDGMENPAEEIKRLRRMVEFRGQLNTVVAFEKIELQRDKMLTALKGLTGLAKLRPGHLHEYRSAVADAEAIIAEVEAGQ